MLLYGVAIATGPFQRKGMWSAAGSWGEGGGELRTLGWEWGLVVRKCVKKWGGWGCEAA